MNTIIVDNIAYSLPYGQYKMGGALYTVNSMGVFETTLHGTKHICDEIGQPIRENKLVIDIMVKGLYREINRV